MSRERRQKASDVFKDANFVFADKVPFEEAFPQLKSVSVRVEEFGHSVGKWNTRHYDRVGEYIDCRNSLCYNGGFSIGELIRDMVRTKETEREETKFCQGYEGSPKGRRKYKDCMNRFQVRVTLEYKDDTSDETPN